MESERPPEDTQTSENPPARFDGEPEKKRYRVVGNNHYKWLLTGTLGIGLIFNLYAIFMLRQPLPVIGLFLQIAILVSIFEKWRYQELLVKLWAIIYIIAGIAGVVASTFAHVLLQAHRYDPKLSSQAHPVFLIFYIFLLAIGLYFFSRYKYNSDEIIHQQCEQ
jgi:hypothetical protein